MINQLQTALPTRKVTVGAAIGAGVVIVVWMIKEIWKFEVPSAVACAITTALSFLAGYITPSHDRDLVIKDSVVGTEP